MVIILSLVKYVHFLTESVMEDQKQTSEEEQTQDSGRKNKRTFVSKCLNLHCPLYVVFPIMFHRTNEVKFNISFRNNTSKVNVCWNSIVLYSLKLPFTTDFLSLVLIKLLSRGLTSLSSPLSPIRAECLWMFVSPPTGSEQPASSHKPLEKWVSSFHNHQLPTSPQLVLGPWETLAHSCWNLVWLDHVQVYCKTHNHFEFMCISGMSCPPKEHCFVFFLILFFISFFFFNIFKFIKNVLTKLIKDRFLN